MYVLARFGFFLNCGHPNFGMNHVKTQYNSYIFTFLSEFCSNIQIKLNNNMILPYIKRIIQDCSIFSYTYMLLPCVSFDIVMLELRRNKKKKLGAKIEEKKMLIANNRCYIKA